MGGLGEVWRRERQCITCPRSHVFSIWITVSAAVEQGSIPAHSMVTMECTSPAPETACDKVESKKLVRVRKTRYSKQIKSKLIKLLVFCHYPNVLSTIG
jgi:hypothetical protein